LTSDLTALPSTVGFYLHVAWRVLFMMKKGFFYLFKSNSLNANNNNSYSANMPTFNQQPTID